jgi:transposase-like protein
MVKSKKRYCPDCGELLRLQEGCLTNKSNTRAIAVYSCDECNQSFGVSDGELGYVPFDADMKRIVETCKTCGREYNFRKLVVYILGDDMRFIAYCPDCAVEFLRNWQRSLKSENIEAVTIKNVQEIAELYELDKANEVMNDPVKVKAIRDSLGKR